MSLTSYRAAPPRDKPLRAFENQTEANLANARGRRSTDPEASWEGNPGNAPGCERYVPTQVRFGKGRRPSFQDFMAVGTAIIALNLLIRAPLARKFLKGQRRLTNGREPVRQNNRADTPRRQQILGDER